MRLIERIWYKNHWMSKVAAPLLLPLSWIVGRVARKRRQQFLSGEIVSYRPPVPIVIVGNLTAGGNGKTPVVIWLVETLRSMGMKPAVISRGYGGKSEHYPFVLDETITPSQAGDEPVLIYQRTNVPVAVSPSRVDAVKALLSSSNEIDIIISDDGLQHYPLARDVEIVVVDAQRQFGNRHFLPLGPLREDLTRLNSVDFIIYNNPNKDAVDLHLHSNVPHTQMQLQPTQLINVQTNERLPIDFLDEDICRRSVAIAGIGNPQRFFDTLASLSIKPTTTRSFADHHAFTFNEIMALTPHNDNLLMTEKDAVKCRALLVDAMKDNPEIQVNWWYLVVDAVFPHQTVYALLHKIEKIRESYGSQTS